MSSLSDAMSTHTHDAYFKASFSDPGVAADAIRRLLDPALADAIDWDHIEHIPTDFISDDLQNHRADLILRVTLRGEPAFLFILYEHQSSVDPMMPFRVVVYMVRLWQGHLRDNPGARHLPPIVPIVLYNGARPWTAPLDFHDLFTVDPSIFETLAPFLPSFRVLLDDLVRTTDDAIEQSTRRALATLALLVLKHAPNDKSLDPFVARLTPHLVAALAEPGGLDALVRTLYYVYEHSDLERGAIESLIAPRVDPQTREVIMTTAQKLRAEGREEGRAEGREEGRKEERADKKALLVGILERRFGKIPDALAERILTADGPTRDRWLDRIFHANTLDELLAE
ncbi:MAG: Rpn family recombination-promoting nuclease/putative transposase [bacterium]